MNHLGKTNVALCIGHPGHELSVYEWVRRNRPLTDVITDGSGSDRPSRFDRTERMIVEIGGRFGFLRGAYGDRHFYGMILKNDPTPFIEIARGLAAEWLKEEIELVAGDKLEGFNPTHDLCRMLINAAVEWIERRSGRKVTNLEFSLESVLPPQTTPGTVVLALDDKQLAQKHEAAVTAYPAIAGEIRNMIARHGRDAFRAEYLFPANGAIVPRNGSEAPYYETYGRRQIAAGHYRELITLREHIEPIGHALSDWAQSGE